MKQGGQSRIFGTGAGSLEIGKFSVVLTKLGNLVAEGTCICFNKCKLVIGVFLKTVFVIYKHCAIVVCGFTNFFIQETSLGF